MRRSEQYVGQLAKRLPAREVGELPPRYHHISAKDILIERCDHFIRAIGIPESPIESVPIENLYFDTPNAPVQLKIEGNQSQGIIVQDGTNLAIGDWPAQQ